MGELQLCLDQDYQNASFVTRYVAPGDGELINFQPGSGIAMGYDDLKVIEAHRLVQSIATGQPVGATIHDALKAAEIVDAMAESAANRTWVTLKNLQRGDPLPDDRARARVFLARRGGSRGSSPFLRGCERLFRWHRSGGVRRRSIRSIRGASRIPVVTGSVIFRVSPHASLISNSSASMPCG